MENWIVGTKFIILFYCIIRFVIGDMALVSLVLLSTLVYVSLNMLSHVLKHGFYKRGLLVLSCIVLIYSAFQINPVFILLLPVNVVEIAASFTESRVLWTLFALTPVVLSNGAFQAEYLLIGLIVLVIFSLSHKACSSIRNLKEQNERLKEKNDILYDKLSMETEYESQVKYLTQLEERNSLAQRIHDKVGHAMAGSLIQLEAASVLLDRDREKAAEILGKVIQNLKAGMEDIRSTLRNIKPAPEQLGINRLKVLLDEFSFNYPIKTGLTFKGSMDTISHAQWRIILDNIKECLTNALKHASASAVHVDIEVMNKLIRLEVRDNGTGTPFLKKGLGITGMEERTENAGGKLIIDSSRGFSIITLLPVSEVTHADKSTHRG